MATLTDRGFTLLGGGPFLGLVRRLHMATPEGHPRVAWLVAIAWLPIMLGSTLRLAFGLPLNPIALDISVHTRFLVSLPLLFMSGRLLEQQIRGVVIVLYQGDLADPAKVDDIFDGARRLRDNGWVELTLALAALALGQLSVWGVLGPTGIVHGLERHREWSFARVWYGTISFPLWQFLSLRWVWRWGVWIYVIVRISRVPLAATASHPDHAGGMSCFAWPLTGYNWYVAAFSSVLAGAWATQLLDHRITVPSLGPTAAVLVVAATVVGYAPLLVLTPQLWAAKRRDLANNTLLGFDYMRRFNAKWLPSPRSQELLGSSDIQSLNDLGSAFQMVLTTRITVFDLRKLKDVALAVVLPLLPLIATVVPIEHIVTKVFNALLPGI